MGYIAVAANPGWMLLEGSDASVEANWWEIPAGFVADASNPGWYLRENSDPTQQANWVHDPSIVDAPTGLVQAIDVSSAQPDDLSGLIALAGAELVVVKLYQTVETIGSRQTGAQKSAAQVASARANGKKVLGYSWGYIDRDPRTTVQEGVSLLRSLSMPEFLFLDIETYGVAAPPGADWIAAALDECAQQGLSGLLVQNVIRPGGVYSGKYVWSSIGNPSFPGVPLWSANYDGNPTLDTPSYGDMALVAHQYSSMGPDGVTPLDCSVFDAAFVG